MKATVVGIMKGKTKNNKEFVRYNYTKNFTDYEMENGECAGVAVGTEFSYHDYNIKPGDVCDFQYEPGFEGRATLSDVVVLQSRLDDQLKAKDTEKAK